MILHNLLHRYDGVVKIN